jgi:two-component sensor histidine kinase
LNLEEMVRTIVEPHERFLTGSRSRFDVKGPSVVCGEHALNGAALMFHELATNAVKYGALATDAGRISITWAATDSELVFDWRESGGPGITGEPQVSGFGSKLLNDTIKHQFSGRLDHNWRPEGLNVRVSIPLDRLTH